MSLLLGIVGYMAFLLKLQFVTQSWYYVEMLCLCAISLDGILSANRLALRPWGLLRIGFMVGMMTWYARPAWEEAHTRRSNVDLIAVVLGQNAAAGDLIIVQDPFNGITFERYYHGQAPWVTIPPIDSHKVHRNDLILEKMHQPDTMAPVLRKITDTLRGGNSVWLVGQMMVGIPKPLPEPAPQTREWLPYLNYWNAQAVVLLQDQARQKRILDIPVNGPVSIFENLSATRFSDYKSDAN